MMVKSSPLNRCSAVALALAAGALFFGVGTFRALALNPERSLHQYNCQTWRRANGLPVTGVDAIAQSADGRMWLGASKGLITFDGIEFRLVPRSTADEEHEITAIVARPQGGLWYGMEGASYGIFDGVHYAAPKVEVENGITISIRALAKTSSGELLLAGSTAAGIFRSNSWHSILPTNIDTFCIHEDDGGRIWIGTAYAGLYCFENGKLTKFPDPKLETMIVSAVIVDKSGDVWVGVAQDDGLRRYDASFHQKTVPSQMTQVNSFLEDEHGVLWIGTLGRGLVRFANEHFEAFGKSDGLAADRVLSIAESRDGSLWVGSSDGLSELSDVKFPILSDTEGLVSELCLSVVPARGGGVWAGTANGLSFRAPNGRITNYSKLGGDGFSSRWIKRMFAASNGDLYVLGGQKDMDRFSKGVVDATWTSNTWPRDVAEDAHGILVAWGGALTRLVDKRFVPFQLANGASVDVSWVNNILAARDGTIWLTADYNLFWIRDGVLHDCIQENKRQDLGFTFICEDDQGVPWAVSRNGLARVKNGVLKFVTRAQGLPTDGIYAIVADTLGNFWMDASCGIIRVSQSDLNAMADGATNQSAFLVYGGQDDVKTTEPLARDYSGCRTPDGRIWFPCSKGVIIIDPARVPGDSPPSMVSIDRVRVNGQQVDPRSPGVLKGGPGNLEFDYSALDYAAPLKLRYRYRLDGFDSDWQPAGARRSAFYTNLKPGRYGFRVQARNGEGPWGDTEATFSLDLPAIFYQTLWFRAGLAAALAGLGVYVARARTMRRKQERLQQANELMEIKVRERTAELANANAALHEEIEQRKRAQSETERLQSQLIAASRQAGMADVAIGVLHNVGNVLNSVNVSTQLVRDRLRASPVESLDKAAGLMREKGDGLGAFLSEDPRGKALPKFLTGVAKVFAADKRELSQEMETLARNIDHIKVIVAMQQSFAKPGGVHEPIEPRALLEDALQINAASLDKHGVTILREIRPTPNIMVDRHKALQILINLICNAGHAVESNPGDKRVTISVDAPTPERVRFVVSDNGSGIAPEDQPRIF